MSCFFFFSFWRTAGLAADNCASDPASDVCDVTTESWPRGWQWANRSGKQLDIFSWQCERVCSAICCSCARVGVFLSCPAPSQQCAYFICNKRWVLKCVGCLCKFVTVLLQLNVLQRPKDISTGKPDRASQNNYLIAARKWSILWVRKQCSKPLTKNKNKHYRLP